MNKYDYYDNLKKYKKNYLQHAKSKLYGIQQDDHQYYKRIGEPGNYRYFYSKDQWDAYQKERAGMTGYEDWKKNQDAKEMAKEKADMTGYEDWKKKEDNKKDLEESYKQTDSYKQEQAKAQAEEKERLNNALTKSITTVLKEAIDNDDADLFVKNIARTDEYKILKDLSKKIYLDYYNSNEDYPVSVRIKNELQKYAKEIQNKYDIKFDNETDNNDMLDFIQESLYNAVIDGRKTANKILDTKNRDKEIANATLKNVTASLLNSDDPKDNQRGVNLELGKYTDYLNQSVRSIYEIKNNYFDYLTSMSILRKNEEKDPSNGLPIIPTEMSIEETMRYINPGRQSGVSDISGGGNCRLCTLALDLRMRGYDVSAPMYSDADNGFSKGDYNITGISLGFFQIEFGRELSDKNGLNQMYKTKPEMIMDDDPVALKEKVSEQVNSYGCLDVNWNDYNFGHAMFYTVDGDGNITVYDAQINEKQDLDEIFNESHEWRFTRTDNLEPDYEYLKEHNWIIYR